AGGHIVGGLSEYTGTGGRPGIPLDFVLRDILQMRRSTPPAILAGPYGFALTHARGDDVQVVAPGEGGELRGGLPADTVIVAPGRNGVLDTPPGAYALAGDFVVAGPDGIADTE